MSKVSETVFKCHTKLMKERGIERESCAELEVRRANGIDSLGIVNLILDIEEELNIDMDEYLPSIRKCKTIGEIVNIIENACA
ncbi:acyl carrier protein [Clostridium tepidiprofundi DSM 19306]|uniref:Acyl carrier protein n=1 Tax=Clostridium tepidiprofundi DSM 19306 TaxID=1121338 RepID=A0A151B201_9CLOT|nr:acyl carrier protein [Clostridium tepidiprofundi]KYH33959.1 acyl carrier protein [Clostridium tepidiprofundi DSM 19306]